MPSGSTARNLVDRNVGGWLRNDEAGILSTLAAEAVSVESHGPTYRGREEVRRWVRAWIEAGNRVTRWEVISFVDSGDSAAFEWDFECVADGVRYRIAGMSAVRLSSGQIAAMHEYRMTDAPHPGRTHGVAGSVTVTPARSRHA